MDQSVKPFTPEGADARRWVGRLIIAVLLGEAIWNLIVSVMNNLFVPWLGDVMGQSSGLPTSFTQRPYNYPDLFVSVFEACIAGLIAAVLNYFVQRPTARKMKTVQGPVPVTPVQLLRTIPQAAPSAIPSPIPSAIPPSAAPSVTPTETPSPVVPFAPAARVEPISATTPAAMVPPPPSVAPLTPAPVAKPAAVAPAAPAVADSVVTKPLPPAPKTQPAKAKKPKEVYYNIVGEPMPSDDD